MMSSLWIWMGWTISVSVFLVIYSNICSEFPTIHYNAWVHYGTYVSMSSKCAKNLFKTAKSCVFFQFFPLWILAFCLQRAAIALNYFWHIMQHLVGVTWKCGLFIKPWKDLHAADSQVCSPVFIFLHDLEMWAMMMLLALLTLERDSAMLVACRKAPRRASKLQHLNYFCLFVFLRALCLYSVCICAYGCSWTNKVVVVRALWDDGSQGGLSSLENSMLLIISS